MNPAIVVTGAASGIGREIARLAAGDGAFLLLVDKERRALGDLAAELVGSGAQAHAFAVDLVDPDCGQRIAGALSERGLYCDVLVNSAGFGLFGPAAALDRAAQVDLVDVNARALTELSLLFLPGMIARGRGGILNVGSITGYAPGPYMAVYYASKAYVRSFSAALAAEVAGTGVTVTCLIPGVVRTAFFDRVPVIETRLYKLVPRTDAPATAAAGWRGFKAGKRVVIPRVLDRVIAAACNVLPDRVVARVVASLQRPRAHTPVKPPGDDGTRTKD
jgi:short-subunit dehydrogenase